MHGCTLTNLEFSYCYTQYLKLTELAKAYLQNFKSHSKSLIIFEYWNCSCLNSCKFWLTPLIIISLTDSSFGFTGLSSSVFDLLPIYLFRYRFWWSVHKFTKSNISYYKPVNCKMLLGWFLVWKPDVNRDFLLCFISFHTVNLSSLSPRPGSAASSLYWWQWRLVMFVIPVPKYV